VSAAVLIVGLIAWGALLYFIFAPMDAREASDRLREERHPGYMPDEVARSFREPMER
jgi:hypothetical protein